MSNEEYIIYKEFIYITAYKVCMSIIVVYYLYIVVYYKSLCVYYYIIKNLKYYQLIALKYTLGRIFLIFFKR